MRRDLSPHRVDGSRSRDQQLPMRYMREDPRKLEHGLGPTLPAGCRSGHAARMKRWAGPAAFPREHAPGLPVSPGLMSDRPGDGARLWTSCPIHFEHSGHALSRWQTFQHALDPTAPRSLNIDILQDPDLTDQMDQRRPNKAEDHRDSGNPQH
jgi:hypothetical protein